MVQEPAEKVRRGKTRWKGPGENHENSRGQGHPGSLGSEELGKQIIQLNRAGGGSKKQDSEQVNRCGRASPEQDPKRVQRPLGVEQEDRSRPENHQGFQEQVNGKSVPQQ